jgi:hypothetical protein
MGLWLKCPGCQASNPLSLKVCPHCGQALDKLPAAQRVYVIGAEPAAPAPPPAPAEGDAPAASASPAAPKPEKAAAAKPAKKPKGTKKKQG